MAPPRIPTPSLRHLPISSTLPRRPPLSPHLRHHRHRPYHSHEHAAPPPFPPTQSAILSAALTHVPTHGFTSKALTLGALDAGYPAVSTNLFARGAFELVNYHLVTARLSLNERLRRRFPLSADGEEEASPWRALGVGARVKILVLERLGANRERGIVGRWQEALALMALPRYIPPSVHELALLVDEIWFLADDKSVDTSWYTKRASLAAVYSSTEVFMTQDTSRDFVETEAFLERRLQDVRRVGMGVGALGQWVGFTGMGVVNGLRSKGVRI